MIDAATTTYENLLPRIVDVLPAFSPAYQECLSAEGGELLPHMAMSSLTRFLTEQFRASLQDQTAKSLASADHVFNMGVALLETAMQSPDERVLDLIGCSFLENLGFAGDDYLALVRRLGPSLKAAYHKGIEGGVVDEENVPIIWHDGKWIRL